MRHAGTFLAGACVLLSLTAIVGRRDATLPEAERPLATRSPAPVGPRAIPPRTRLRFPTGELPENVARLVREVDGRARLRTEPDPGAPLVVESYDSGCFTTDRAVRTFERKDGGFAADDGAQLTAMQLDALRARLLESRPEPDRTIDAILARPDEYLAELGFTDELIAAHAHEVWEHCRGGRVDEQGEPLALPPELEVLFTVPNLKPFLAQYLLSWSKLEIGTRTLIELPGDPWIHVGCASNRPDFVPWYVVVGDESWFLLDRELSRALVELTSERGWMKRNLEVLGDWRETIWSGPAWDQTWLEAQRVLKELSYRRVPGWEAVETRFKAADLDPRGPEHGLPWMTLVARGTPLIERVLVRYERDADVDWNDVLAAYGEAETLSTKQPRLVGWRREFERGLALRLPDPMQEVEALWSELDLPGTPRVALTFSRELKTGSRWTRLDVGRGVLGPDGTLLVLASHAVHGPLVRAAPEGLDHAREGTFAVVRPDGTLESGRHAR